MDSCSAPDRCLICYELIIDNGEGNEGSGSEKGVSKSSLSSSTSSLLSEQLQPVFTLRNILEIPREKLIIFLRKFDSPSEWIRLCCQCNDRVKRAKDVYEAMLEVQRRFRGLQQEIVKLVKTSCSGSGGSRRRSKSFMAVTDECRAIIHARNDSDYFTNPFIAGDLRACELAAGEEHVKQEPQDDLIVPDDDPRGGDFDYGGYPEAEDEVEDEDENEWPPPAELTTKISHKSKSLHSSRKRLQKKPESIRIEIKEAFPIICPLCQKFQCSVKNGEQFCEHLEICTKDDLNMSYNLTCPVCQVYSVGIENKVEFAEHVGWCGSDGQRSGTDPVIPLAGRIFSCDVCDKHTKFMKLDAFLHHYLYHKRFKYKCSHCPHRFATNSGCFNIYHYKIRHPNFIHPVSSRVVLDPWTLPTFPTWCPVCGDKFQSDTVREEHIQEEHPTITKDFSCHGCSSGFYSADELRLHEGTAHSEGVEGKSVVYSCQWCPATFPKMGLLRQHKIREHETATVTQTRKRQRESSNSGSEEEEEESDEKEENSAESDVEEESCRSGGYSIKKFQEILKKVRVRKDQRSKREANVICPLCQNFKCELGQSEVLYHHLETCEKNDQEGTELQCPTCNQFTRREPDQHVEFAQHVASCTGAGEGTVIPALGSRLFQCDICEEGERKWMRIDEFLDHYLYHTRYRYKCTKCRHRFCTDESRDTHYHYKMLHPSHLQDHPSTRAVHEPNLPYISWCCPVCNEKFPSDEQRDKHFDEIHHDSTADYEKRHVCQWCSRGYHCEDELRLHQCTQHVYNERQRKTRGFRGKVTTTTAATRRTPVTKKKKKVTSKVIVSSRLKDSKTPRTNTVARKVKNVSDDSDDDDSDPGQPENTNADEDWQPPSDLLVSNDNDDDEQDEQGNYDDDDDISKNSDPSVEFQQIQESSFTKQIFQQIVKQYRKKYKKAGDDDPFSSPKLFLCNICPELEGMNLEKFLTHYLYHKRQTYRCVRCLYRFTSNASNCTSRHYKYNHPEYEREPAFTRCVKDPVLPEYSWSCFHCNQKFQTESLRDSHLKSEHSDKEYSRSHKCHCCDTCYPNLEELFFHMAEAHVQVTKVTGGEEVKEQRCNICFEQFSRLSHLKSHQREMHREELFMCSLCDKQCKSDNGLRQHFERCKKAQKVKLIPEEELKVDVPRELPKTKYFWCSLCKEFKARGGHVERLCQHLDICKKKVEWEEQGGNLVELILTCTLCNVYTTGFENKIELAQHMSWCSGKDGEEQGQGETEAVIPLRSRIFECSICTNPKKYLKLDAFLSHYLHHMKNRYKCVICGILHCNQSTVNSHFIKKHKNMVKKIPASSRFQYDDRLPQFSWWCHYCNAAFPTDDLRNAHVTSEHHGAKLPTNSKLGVLPPVASLSSEIKEHRCVQCDKGYDFLEELKLHEGTAHVTENSMFSCDECNETFTKAKLLRQHKLDRHRSDNVVCEVCGMHMMGKSLKNHMQTHQDVRMFICEEPGCGESFTTKCFLRLHRFRKHAPRDADKNPLVCTLCPEPRAFHNKSYLRNHIENVHFKKFAIQCHICGKGLQYNSKLRKHLYHAHNIGKLDKFKCIVQGCGKEYTSKAKLKHHMDRHRGDPHYKCNFCGKEFYDSSHLRRHELIHTNAESKPYQCEICAKRFPVRNYLYIHMRSHKKRGEIE